MHAFDRQTEFSSLDRICVSCSAVKIRFRFNLDVVSVSTVVTLCVLHCLLFVVWLLQFKWPSLSQSL